MGREGLERSGNTMKNDGEENTRYGTKNNKRSSPRRSRMVVIKSKKRYDQIEILSQNTEYEEQPLTKNDIRLRERE